MLFAEGGNPDLQNLFRKERYRLEKEEQFTMFGRGDRRILTEWPLRRLPLVARLPDPATDQE